VDAVGRIPCPGFGPQQPVMERISAVDGPIV